MPNRTWIRPVAGGLAVVAVGWFFGGVTGLIAAGAGLAVAARLGPRWVAGGAFAALVVAAFATVLEVRPTSSYSPNFASDRPVASQSALVAGVLVFVAVVSFAIRERTPVESGPDAGGETRTDE